MIVLSFVRFAERLGTSMQLISIENLSLAAEVTVVLLLLSFAWPQNRQDHVESSVNGESISWEPVKIFFLHNCTYRGLYLNQWRKNLLSGVAVSPAKPFHPPLIEDDENARIPAPWQDRLTHLLNRQGFDAILNAWQSVDSQYRGASCVSMISLSSYSELISAHGAMVTEQAIQRIGKQLSTDMSHDSIIARYLPDRFVVLHFAATSAESHRTMALFHEKTMDNAFFQIVGVPLHLSSSISMLGLESESDVNGIIELLDEGASEAERSGRAILSLEDNDWTETPVGLKSPSIETTPSNPDTQSISSATNGKNAVAPEEVVPDPEIDLTSVESSTNQSNREDTQPDSSDISAVASPDDIAALFAQINTQKSGAVAIAPSPLGDTGNIAKLPDPKEAPTAPAAEVSEAATADDIAALFATVKPNVKPAAPAPPVPEMDKSEAATADDIAALFASVKPTIKAPRAATPVANPDAAKTLPSETAKPAAQAVDPNEAASMDDIAALFATVKPTTKPANISAPTAPKAQPLATAKTGPEAVDPNEAASADDIAALFATVKPRAQAPIAPNPIAPNPIAANASELSASERAESATADDIAALFATVKTAVKPAPKPATQSTPPEPAQSPSKAPASPIPIGEQLAEVATADDIAMLLASVKPTTAVSSQTEQTSKPAPQSIPASKQSNELVSKEELSSNASIDDIEALFAAMKK